jgi:FMN phosphatase YigB (HAD superfamily)
MILLFDAANTLIHKPLVFKKMIDVFTKQNYIVDYNVLIYHHKLISELIIFPDVTSKEFYKDFNAELLYSLGIIPTLELLTLLHQECSYMPWEKFDDASALDEIKIPKYVLSNFNTSLNTIIEQLYPNVFEKIISSEEQGLRKPNEEFYLRAIELLNIKNANEILYVGDSLKLDIEPANTVGMNAILLDRMGYYSTYKKRVRSLNELITTYNDLIK